MNTRIQVESSSNRDGNGVDLVREQIRIAAHLKLNYKQSDIELKGHALECRINAENPQKIPSFDRELLQGAHFPGGNGIRVDTCVYNGCKIPPYYDSMLAKLIVHAGNRKEAIAKMQECSW